MLIPSGQMHGKRQELNNTKVYDSICGVIFDFKQDKSLSVIHKECPHVKVSQELKL